MPQGGLLSYFTRHRTAANLLLVVLLVVGLAALPRMRAQFFPDVIIDNVSVSVLWQGAGAEDVDSAIVQVLEPALLTVEGVEGSTSTSREGRAVLSLDFEPGWDMGRAADDVQVAVDAVTTLPDDAEDPVVRRGAWRDRVTDVVISGPVAIEQLSHFADEFALRLFAAGVTRTTIRGVAAPETVIEVASVNLMAHDVSIAEIATAIAQEVDADPAGDVQGANARVRTGVEKRSADQIAGVVLRSNPDGSKLTVGDVADVRVEGVDRNRTYFVGDDPAISIRVDRSQAGDAIKVQEQVAKVAQTLQATLPDGVSIELIRTRAEAITGRLNILLDNGLVGLGLVLALLFLFLNARTAFWVAAGIPVSMLAAIALMYMAGLTINMVSLFALIITLGIVVDDAIVVGEHADARVRKLKETPTQAAERAARLGSDTDLKVIAAIFGKMGAAHSKRDPSDEAALDAAFHLAIFEASHNVVMLHMMRSMYELLRGGVFYNRQVMFKQRTNRAALLDQHRAINDALQARDGDAARTAIEAHLDFVEASLADQQKAERNERVARQRLEHETNG